MLRSIKLLLKGIVIWTKNNLKELGGLFAIGVPIIAAVWPADAGLTKSIVVVVSIVFGWILIFVGGTIRNESELFGMPTPRKRFTFMDNGRIMIKREDLCEVSVYLYDLEEYLEKVGKSDENKVKK